MKFLVEYGIEMVMSLLVSGFIYLMNKFKKTYRDLMTTRAGVKALLKGRIVEKYSEYNETGKMTLYDKEAINTMYGEYKNLGGNGVVDQMVLEMVESPIYTCEGGRDG